MPGRDFPTRWRKRPVVIEAMQWNGGRTAATRIIDWIHANGGSARWHERRSESLGPYRPDDLNVLVTPEHITIDTLEGPMRVDIGVWIIRGVAGEFYGCKPDIFAATYERAGAISDHLDALATHQGRTHFVGDDCPGGHRDDPHVGDPA